MYGACRSDFGWPTESRNSLKERVIHRPRLQYEDFWALKEVSFEVKEGESVGHPGPQWLGQIDPLEVHLWRSPAHVRRGRRSRKAGGHAGVRGRISSRI